MKKNDRFFKHYKHATVQQIECLLFEHFDGSIIDMPPPHSRKRLATLIALNWGYLATPNGMDYTRITDDGRELLCYFLAEHAEKLKNAELAQIDWEAEIVASGYSYPRSNLVGFGICEKPSETPPRTDQAASGVDTDLRVHDPVAG
jgi:hypothetical protein